MKRIGGKGDFTLNRRYIAALNSDKEHIDVLFDIVQENLHGWTVESDNGLRAGLARALGAEK